MDTRHFESVHALQDQVTSPPCQPRAVTANAVWRLMTVPASGMCAATTGAVPATTTAAAHPGAATDTDTAAAVTANHDGAARASADIDVAAAVKTSLA